VDLQTLTDYWLGELDADQQSRIELHLMSCESCSDRMEKVAELGMALREFARSGGVRTFVSSDYLDTLRAEGLRIREYHQVPGGSVECTVTSADDLLVAHLGADLAEVSRLDAQMVFPEGSLRFSDIPFPPGGSEVVLSEMIPFVRTLPSHTMRLKLISVEASAERVLAEYTFHHTAYGG
jgi:hypothetical protein